MEILKIIDHDLIFFFTGFDQSVQFRSPYYSANILRICQIDSCLEFERTHKRVHIIEDIYYVFFCVFLHLLWFFYN